MEEIVLKNGLIYDGEHLVHNDIHLNNDGIIINYEPNILVSSGENVLDCQDKIIMPGFVDLKTAIKDMEHLTPNQIREVVQSSREGGYSNIAITPIFTKRLFDTYVLDVLDLLRSYSSVLIHFYYPILSDGYQKVVSDSTNLSLCKGISDDGYYVSEREMYQAMSLAKEHDIPLIGSGNRYYDHNNIHNHDSEYNEIERNIIIAKETGCHYHIANVTTLKELSLIRTAKKEGINITCGVSVSNLLMTKERLESIAQMLSLSGKKLDASIRENAFPQLLKLHHVKELLNAVLDGTIDVICTDSEVGLKTYNIAGIHYAFQLLFNELVVKGNYLTLEQLLKLMITNPSNILGIDNQISLNNNLNINIWDLNHETTLSPTYAEGNSIFDYRKVYGIKTHTYN